MAARPIGAVDGRGALRRRAGDHRARHRAAVRLVPGLLARAPLRAVEPDPAAVARRSGQGCGGQLRRDGGRAVGGLPVDALGARPVVGGLGGAIRRGDGRPRAARAGGAAAALLPLPAARSSRALRAARPPGDRAPARRWSASTSGRSSAHTKKANAALAGIGRTRRILLSDTLLADYSDDEIEVVLAHELSHHVHHDLWRGMALQAALHRRRFLRRRGGRSAGRCRGSGCAASPTSAGVPLLLLVAGVCSFACCRSATPCRGPTSGAPIASPSAHRQARRVHLRDEAPVAAEPGRGRPSRLVRWLFYSHPPIRERIAAAQAWADVATPLHAHGILPAKE